MFDDWREESVEQWGYVCSSPEHVESLVWAVRFKPAVTLLVVILGLAFDWPWLLVVAGVLGIVGTVWQEISWIDLLYNHLFRHWTKTPILGPDPHTRRWICGAADLFVLLAGLASLADWLGLAWFFGGVVVFLAGMVVLTGICVPAYLYRQWQRMRSAD